MYFKNIILFILIFFFISCDIFLTRSAEEPNTNLSLTPPATTPEQLIDNFKLAIANKDPQEYLKFFSDSISSIKSFIFIPNQKVYLEFPTIFSNWNTTNEEQYFTFLKLKLNSFSAMNLILENQKMTKFQSDSAILIADYKLTIPHNEQNLTKLFIGKANFYFILNKSKFWVCYKWEDFETSKDSSWSLCKGFFSK